MQPQCPHCREPFDTWPEARIHVKHCKQGKPRKSVAERLKQMTQYGGNTKEANAPILAAPFWKKGTQIIGEVTRSFTTENGVCYTIELKKPMEVNRAHTYPQAAGTEKLERVSVGALKGFQMALDVSGVPDGKLRPGDDVQITCTGTTASNKGNDQIDFDVQIDRR